MRLSTSLAQVLTNNVLERVIIVLNARDQRLIVDAIRSRTHLVKGPRNAARHTVLPRKRRLVGQEPLDQVSS